MNLRAVLWLLSRVMLFIAGFMLVPAAVSLAYDETSEAASFAVAAGVGGALGLLLGWRNSGAITTVEGRPDFFRREGLAAVGLSWLVACTYGALPYLLTGSIPAPADAFFESVSGFTTTGATILPGAAIDALPRGISFWRSFTHWIGGIGIVLVFVVFFPTGGRSLFRSEVAGVAREAVQQRVRDSALAIARIYIGLTVLEMLALLWAGLDLYDAAIHTFGTVATAGFSSHSASVGHFASWTIEATIVVFMFLAGINFALYDTLIRRGPRKALGVAWRSTELRSYVGLLVGATVLVTFVLWFWGGSNGVGANIGVDAVHNIPHAPPPDYSSLLLCLRDSVFACTSMGTTTGFVTADFDQWPEVCRYVLMTLGMVGGCAGSTAGGLKLVRFLIVARVAIRSVQNFSRPRAINTVKMDGEVLDEATVASVTGYFALWFIVLIGGSAVLAVLGVEVESAITAGLACLNNIGPGLDQIGPAVDYSHVPVIGKGVLSLMMIVGRLEFYALVVLLLPRFWRS